MQLKYFIVFYISIFKIKYNQKLINNMSVVRFKLIGGEAANVFKCGMAKITNAAGRLQSALEY